MRAGTKISWRRGQDQAELRGRRCHHMKLAVSQLTSCEGLSPVLDSSMREAQKRRQALV